MGLMKAVPTGWANVFAACAGAAEAWHLLDLLSVAALAFCATTAAGPGHWQELAWIVTARRSGSSGT